VRSGLAERERFDYAARMLRPIQIAPSILAADFGRLADEIADVAAGGADLIHVDVMDGTFVPNLTLGPDIVRAARKATTLPIDVHMMVMQPERHIEAFAAAGADIITVHVEATIHLQRTLNAIRQLGKRAGVALNPHTSEQGLEYVLDDIDLILVLTINPGFSGQAFLPGVLPKISSIQQLISSRGRDISIEVDGGINPQTAPEVTRAGADILVTGAAVYAQPDRRAAIETIRTAAKNR
jgi:ribulose-phosphate 3-epimerase